MTGYHAKVIVGVISHIGLIVIGWMLPRVVPWTPLPGLNVLAELAVEGGAFSGSDTGQGAGAAA
jgi:hypothetical protein